MTVPLAATVAMTHALAPIDGALPGALARWATAFVAFLLMVATLYRFAPSGGREGLPFVTVGGTLPTVRETENPPNAEVHALIQGVEDATRGGQDERSASGVGGQLLRE